MPKKLVILFIVLISFLLSGCVEAPAAINAAESLPTDPPVPTDTVASTRTPIPTETPNLTNTPAPTATSTPTDTTVPTETAVPTDTAIPTDTPTNTPTATSTPGEFVEALPAKVVGDSVKIFFIQEKTGGNLCGDSLAVAGTDIPASGNKAKDVANALKKLFSYRTKYVGNLYNPAHRMNVTSVQVRLQDDGTLFIQLGGSMNRTQDDCELDRLRAQIWATFGQYKSQKKYAIYFNKAKLGDLIHSDR